MTEKKKTGKCRRECPRVCRQVTLQVTKLQYPMTDLEAKPATTKDMAETGLCFRTEELYDNGTVLQLAIDLRGWHHYLQTTATIVDASVLSRPLTAIAEVIWAKELPQDEEGGYNIGVRFKDIYEDDLLAFKKYLERLLEITN
ncbi:MAG: hypothetical protein D3923_11895 [Candidatus Electrothrix sp. AR3]|nr:hypothetical protein [Candidatus Electrothrix sp. AR3]